MNRIRRTLHHLTTQDVSRANASEAADRLSDRRLEQEDVDAFLAARRWRYSSALDAASDRWSSQ